MAKLTLTDLGTTLSNTAANTINNNMALIEVALENTLSRDGTSPNQMLVDLDANGNDILNVQTLSAEGLVLNGIGISPETTFVADGDHGDIIVTGGGVSWTIADTTMTPFARTLNNDTSAALARATLELVPGTNVQTQDPALQSIADLVTSANQMIYLTAPDTYATSTITLAGRSLLDDANDVAMRATLGLGTAATTAATDYATAAQGATADTALQPAAIGVTVQGFDTDLAQIAALVSAADRVPYATGAGAWALATFTLAARNLVAATTSAAQRTAMGLGTVSVINTLTGSATYDPPSLADGAGASTTVTVTGAVLGDYAVASFSLSTQGITVTANVTAADTVTVRFQNETTGVIDLASGTLRVRTFSQ